MRRLLIVSVVLALSLGPVATLATEEAPSEAGAFSPAGSFAEGRNDHTATLLDDGRVLIIGGGGEQIRHSVDIWDPATASFEPVGSLATGRKSHTATLLPDGRVLVVGGRRPTAEADVWDPATSSSEPAGTLGAARPQHTATLLPDGRVLLIGGRSADVWDPVIASLEQAGRLIDGGGTATALPDGRVLVVGGTSAEVWEPTTASFIPAGKLTMKRWPHSATLLSDGRVFPVGGQDLGISSTAEVWEPRELPDEQVRDLAAESLLCWELRARFSLDSTTGDPQLDREYLTRCLTREGLLALVQFYVFDVEMGLALHRERCGQSGPSPLPAEE